MYIDLTKLSEGIKEFDETIQIELDDESARLIEPVRMFGELKKGIAQIDVSGKLSAKSEIECSRCLNPLISTIDTDFKVAYILPEHYSSEKESELHGEDLAIAIYDGEKIDLAELAREQILLNLPTQVFCQENCQGLCQKCGANLNKTTCNCETKEIDPRWQSLRQLKIRD